MTSSSNGIFDINFALINQSDIRVALFDYDIPNYVPKTAIVDRMIEFVDHMSVDMYVFCQPSVVASRKITVFDRNKSLTNAWGTPLISVASYLKDTGVAIDKCITVETADSIVDICYSCYPEDDEIIEISLNSPFLRSDNIPANIPNSMLRFHPVELDGDVYEITALKLGEPYSVFLLGEDIETLDIGSLTKKLFDQHIFPENICSIFADCREINSIHFRVCSREGLEVASCGNSAAALLAACVVCGLSEPDIRTKLFSSSGEFELICDRDLCLYLLGKATTEATETIKFTRELNSAL